MTKAELIKVVSERTGATQVATKPMVEAVFEAMTDTLSDGENVEIVGFGKFVVSQRDAHTARNPKTGEAVEVEAKNRVTFAASNLLKATLNPAE